MTTASKTISNTDDIIDSRDVIKRIEYLEAEVEECELCKAGEGDCEDSDHDEYRALKELAEEAEGYAPDWTFGEALIRDSYFEDYARELAEDIGAIKGDESWPLSFIDWERAADALKQDYTSVTFDGVDYWIR